MSQTASTGPSSEYTSTPGGTRGRCGAHVAAGCRVRHTQSDLSSYSDSRIPMHRRLMGVRTHRPYGTLRIGRARGAPAVHHENKTSADDLTRPARLVCRAYAAPPPQRLSALSARRGVLGAGPRWARHGSLSRHSVPCSRAHAPASPVTPPSIRAPAGQMLDRVRPGRACQAAVATP